jgi:glycosyltransferase involved in cell wall biosynthesis
MLGTRGIPASYSGFETCVEELGRRLVQRGHEVTVYCRSHHVQWKQPTYQGMRLVQLPTIANKYFDTIAHSFLSSLHAVTQRYDIALYFIAGNSPVTWIPRVVGQRTLLNVDGLDWKREKWPPLAKRYIQLAERLSTILPDAIITDSRVVQQYYQEHYRAPSTYIAYGAERPRRQPGEVLAKFGLAPRDYVLFVGRLVPENCAHHLVEAWRTLKTEKKCVIVGDAPYARAYQEELKRAAGGDPRIVFTGYVFGEGYEELGSNAWAFVETSGVGGTHPALVEAMAFGNCVVTNATEENLETLGDAGRSYNGRAGAAALAPVLQQLLDAPEKVEALRKAAAARAASTFTWDAVTDAYLALFERVLRDPKARGA